MKRRDEMLALIAGLLLFGAFVMATFFRDTWLGARLDRDFWPLDGSPVGPNLVASMVLGMLMVLVVPPLVKKVKAWAESHRDELEAKASDERSEIQRRLDHIIDNHPDIPSLPPRKVDQ